MGEDARYADGGLCGADQAVTSCFRTPNARLFV